MSNRAQTPDFACDETSSSREITLDPRIVKLTTRTGVDIRRTLPHRHIRTIGAWCFVDHYGPTDQVDAMSVAAHPHAGLQTVSWLFSGEVEHRDSLGSIQHVMPGELNIMTAGKGIAHSELSIGDRAILHGVQLWTVLPDRHRKVEPSFHHHEDLPVFDYEGAGIRLFVGEFLGQRSSARIFSPMVGAEIDLSAGSTIHLPTETSFEYGVLVVAGGATVNGHSVRLGQLHYVPTERGGLSLATTGGAKLVLLGGEPFKEKIVMWWNFIARSHEEIIQMRQDWQEQSKNYPVFHDRIGGRIPAPPLPNLRLTPRGNPTQNLG